jgi:cyclic-di-AMP phosphodiesterase PgpH
MRKYTIKYTASLTAGIALIIFILFSIEDYIYYLVDFSIWEVALLNLVFALVAASILSGGIFLFAPVVGEAMATLKRMLRVESLSNPLLLKLSSEAPGTYHHSLNVSTLAQNVARAVGADTLLIRTAAYYHDLGKLTNPLSFVENQSGSEVPTELEADSIRDNAKKIIAHVEDGVKMATNANLPSNIVDLIREHHGTTRAIYFYQLAKEKGLKIKKTDFRYAGPTPRSKESAILMLSDCVEAIARSNPLLTNNDIKNIVKKTIDERIEDKQFKQVGFSNEEIKKISNSLEETLLSIYHQRLEYK